jgi:hypothetical protein
MDDEAEEDPFSQMDPAWRAPRCSRDAPPCGAPWRTKNRARQPGRRTRLRQADVFSSNMSAVDLQTSAPDPLQIDPPDHRVPQVLDPLFAPRKMATELEPVTS